MFMNRKIINLILLFAAICIICPVVVYMTNRTVCFRIKNGYEIVINARIGSTDLIIRPFYNDADKSYYFFLPHSISDKKIHNDLFGEKVTIDGKSISNLSGFNWDENKTYSIACKEAAYDIRFAEASDIATLFITTESGNVDRINTDETYVETGSMAILEPGGKVSYKGGISIKGRGNFTYEMFNKRPFHITLDESADILGMKKNKDWVLLANTCDYSYMNNKLAFDMAKNAGFGFSPDAEYADVYFNGEFWGLYLVTEKIKVGDNRVEITDLEKENKKSYPDVPDDITGGYLLERDHRTPNNKKPPSWFISKDFDATHIRIRSPKYALDEETEYISSLINEMEHAIVSTDGYSQEGKYYTDYIDLNSWANYYVISEIAYDTDFGLTSTFLYKDRDSIDPKIHMGPCWDFDQAFGAYPDHFSPEVLFKYPDTWFWDLYDKPEFHEEILKCWNSYYSDYLKNEAPARIEVWREQIRSSVENDNIRWNRFDGYERMIPWPMGGDEYGYEYYYDDQVDFFKDWLAKRQAFLDDCWKE